MRKLLLALMLTALPMTTFAVPEWAKVNGVTLRYELSGKGSDTVVLLQESGVPLEIWDEILPTLQAPNRTFLRYDLRGFGLSEKFRGPVTMQDEVNDLRALLDALELRKPVVMLSGALGGSIALQFAAQFPDRVKGVVVTSPSAVLAAKPPRARVNAAADPAAARAADERTLKVTYPVEFRANAERWNKYLGMYYANDPDSEIATEALINTTAFAGVLPKIQCPTLLVATTKFVRPVGEVRELATKIPKGRFVALETGHFASYQSPELTAPVFLQFMKELRL